MFLKLLVQNLKVYPFSYSICIVFLYIASKKGKSVQGVPQSQTVALPRHKEEEETDKSKQAQIEQTY